MQALTVCPSTEIVQAPQMPSSQTGNWTSDADKITLTVTNGPQIELKLDPKDNSCTYRQRLPFGELDVVLVKSPSK